MLLVRVPKKPGPAVIMAAKALAATVVATEADWKVRVEQRPASKARAADVRLDRAWSVVQRRLVDHEAFAADDSDRLRSTALALRLFPGGLSFTQLKFVEEHAKPHMTMTMPCPRMPRPPTLRCRRCQRSERRGRRRSWRQRRAGRMRSALRASWPCSILFA
ncbi:hypothetical protein OEB96_05650 [Paraliomyxa miuraensis]|nr:hypothetical protein [Paraliomyxa miuraensis]